MRWLQLALAAFLCCASFAGDGGLTDYTDFQQVPVRGADLVALVEGAEMVVVVNFALKNVPASEGKSRWKAKVPAYCKELAPSVYKNGKPNTELTIEGDPKAFENAAGGYVSKNAFRPGDSFLVFLVGAGEEGVYRCMDSNPGGFRFYHAIGNTDHRQLLVGCVNGKIAVEGNHGYRGSPMCGPMRVLEALLGAQVGLKLSAKALGGTSVELSFESSSARGVKVPLEMALRAPLLWAEMEGPEGDSVLLSHDDYLLVKAGDPYEKHKLLKQGDPPMTFKVDLPTGPVPEGATLTWAHINHRKKLAGSLPEGTHTVRFYCQADEKSVVISNAVQVEGKAGGARPEDVAAIPGIVKYEQKAEEKGKPAKPGELRKEDLKGEIWFQSNREGSWDIFVMNADGSNLRNVTSTPDRDEFYPRPSPDGKKVAYVAGKLSKMNIWEIKSPAKKEVWVADRDGKTAAKIADNATRPSWGPDGKAIVYTHNDGKAEGTRVHHVDTGKVTDPTEKWKSWLRAGGEAIFATAQRRLAIGGKLWTTANGVLMVMDLDENYEPVKLTPLGTGYFGCNPQWSSTGERLYFAHHDPKFNGAIILWTVKPDGTDPRRFETPTAGKWEGYGMYSESPDGTMIAYTGWDTKREWRQSIAVMRISDGASLFVTEGEKKSVDGVPWWHPGVKGE